MQETWRYHRTKFSDMKEKGWSVIPWPHGQENQEDVMIWLKNNGSGQFCYCQERNKQNWSILIENKQDADYFMEKFGVN